MGYTRKKIIFVKIILNGIINWGSEDLSYNTRKLTYPF